MIIVTSLLALAAIARELMFWL